MPERFPQPRKTDSQNPLTEDQLAFLSEQTRRAAKRGSREGVHRYVKGALVGYLVLVLAIAASFYSQGVDSSTARDDLAVASMASNKAIVESGRAIAVDGCNRDFGTILRVRGVLKRAEDFQRGAYERGDISREAYERGVAYYEEQLRGFPLPDCRNAKNILTDDPSAPITIPDPLYPGHGG